MRVQFPSTAPVECGRDVDLWKVNPSGTGLAWNAMRARERTGFESLAFRRSERIESVSRKGEEAMKV